jgi:hypothetical protein
MSDGNECKTLLGGRILGSDIAGEPGINVMLGLCWKPELRFREGDLCLE